jgi:hypothetical protein
MILRMCAAGAAVCLVFPSLACESMPRQERREHVAGKVAAQETPPEQGEASEKKADAPKPKEAGKEAEKPDKTTELRKKEHELDYARRELKITRLAQQSEEREAKNAIEDAERKLKESTDERDHFRSVQVALKLDESGLGIERAAEHRKRQKEELAELEAMYKEEELATLTKELVINRSRTDVELAQKSLDLEQRKLVMTRDHELPKKQRELDDTVVKAEKTLAEAKAKDARHGLEKELKLLKSEHSIDELEREVAKLKTEVEKQKKPAAPKPEASS